MGWLVKSEEISDPSYGHYPGSRPVEELINNGLFILDKWQGPTSHDAVAMVKEILGVKRAGHTGTLDPAVSGVLPILLGNACKLTPALQGLNKEYVGVMHLHKNTEEKKLNYAIKKFTGKIKQTPPVRSAVARKERGREIYELEILDRLDKDVCFRVKCQAGTYIRKLVSDIGVQLDGAHLTELRRTAVGPFGEKQAHKIQDLKDAYVFWKKGNESIREIILPAEESLEPLKKIVIKDSAVHSVCNGAPLYTAGILRVEEHIAPEDLIAIITLKGEAVALAKSRMESIEMTKKRGIGTQTDRVIMNKGVYPK